METNFTPENAENVCELCDFKCSKRSDWIRHVKTLKHTHRHNGNQKETAGNIYYAEYNCNCGKNFITNSGLWKHKKVCNFTKLKLEIKEPEIKEPEPKPIESNKDELINYLIKENQEFKNLILEIVKKDTYNNSTNNSHNKAFNLQFFLNETCKDAMNIMDFVESIQLQLSDLERVGEVGYVEGISNIIIKNLKELDVSQRPVHCTDKKRETIYIKDEDKWEKDEEQKKMHKVVRKVAAKNARMVLKYKELHPDCNTYSSKYSDQYNKIIIEAMGGSGDNDFEKEEKIIRNISKIITVDK
jgi:hypothetical protein